MADLESFQEFLNGLESELVKLSKSHQLAFCAACCERAFPNYVEFWKREHWGEPPIVRAALDVIWGIIAGANSKPAEIKRLEEQCYSVTPDSEDFGSTLGSLALDASISVGLLLRYCLDGDAKWGLQIASYQRDAIDCFVQTELDPDPSGPKLMDPGIEVKVEAHPLMRRELEKQKSDLAYLIQGLDLAEFCVIARSIERSNVGIPCEE